MKTKEEVLFEDAPVGRAVLSLVIPTVISQLITVIYNLADTFLLGRLVTQIRWQPFRCVCLCSYFSRGLQTCSALGAPASCPVV